jgi:hypothetical protein
MVTGMHELCLWIIAKGSFVLSSLCSLEELKLKMWQDRGCTPARLNPRAASRGPVPPASMHTAETAVLPYQMPIFRPTQQGIIVHEELQKHSKKDATFTYFAREAF